MAVHHIASEHLKQAAIAAGTGSPPRRRRKMRVSIIVSIIVSCFISLLTATGIGWLSLYKQTETITTVTILYDNAFEGVNYAHKAYGEFEHLMRSHQGENASFADDEAQNSIEAIREDLNLANGLATGDREGAMIAEIGEKLDSLAKRENTARAAAFIDHSLIQLVRRFTADRLDSTEAAGRTIARSRTVIAGWLGLALILTIVVVAIMVVTILPQIRHGVNIAEAIAGGKLDNKIVVKGMKETAQLLGALSRMQTSISEHVADLEEARRRAIKSENAKSEFLANMSHELRTPLNNIIGSIQLLSNRPLPEKDKELFDLVGKSSKSLLGIVNDILDLSKIEAGEVKLEHIGFDAFEKLRDVTKLFMAQAGKKNLTMASETAGDNLYMLGDPLRFERILTNLVGNAMRYTERGGIRLRAVVRKDAGGQDRLRCEVIDTGIGIPKDRQDKIFERFTQADSSTSRRYGGTGLGLTITRELIYLMNGEIGVESEVGKGSTFWFEIPFEMAAAGDRPAAAEAPAPEKHEGAIPAGRAKILIAEDHELNRAFMRQLFESLGMTGFTFAETGTEALEKVRKEKFDLVLMDCHMPEMDGYTATAAIRGLPEVSRNGVPIVAMTANAMASEEERCLKAGMNAYLSKPFEFNTFKRVLSPWVNFEDARPASAEAPSLEDSDPADLKLLVASAKGDAVYIREMIGLFISTAEQHLSELKALSGQEGDPRAWTEAAHGLKGVAAIIGAEKLRQLAAQAQIMEETSAEARRDIFVGVDEEYRKLRHFLVERTLA